MIGREAYQNPYLLAEVDQRLWGDVRPVLTREEVIHALLPYVKDLLKTEARLNSITRHTLGLFHGEAGGRGWRRHLSENVSRLGADESVILEALAYTQRG